MSEWIVDSVEDLRPVDWDTGEYGPASRSLNIKCDHCGRTHEVFFGLLNTSTAELKMLGEECIAPATGWKPAPADFDEAKKELAKSRERQRADAIHGYAGEMADELVARVREPRPADLQGWLKAEIGKLDPAKYPRQKIAKEVRDRATILALRKLTKRRR